MAILGAIVVVSSVVPEFEATHILQTSSDFVLSSDLVDVPKDLAKNELPLIMSPVVMDEVLADPALSSVPSLSDPETREREIRKRLKVSSEGTVDLLLITYRDTDKEQVAKVANAIAQSYVQERRRYDDWCLLNLEKSLLQTLEQARRNVEEDRRIFEALSKKTIGINPFARTKEVSVDEFNQDKMPLKNSGIETAELFFAGKKLALEIAFFDKLSERRFALRAEHGRAASIATRSFAKEPSAPIEAPLVKKTLMVAGIAFLLPFVLAMLIGFRGQKIS